MAPSKIPKERNGEKLHLFGGLAGGNGPAKKRIKTEGESPPKNKGKSPVELDLSLSTNGRFGVDPSRRVPARSASGGGESGAGARGRHAPSEKTRSDSAGKGKAPIVYSPAGRESDGGIGVQYSGGGGVDVQYLMESSPQGANQNTMMRDSWCPQRGVTSPVIDRNLNGKEKLLTNALVNMPQVTTLGSCPNHVKIEGILYRYRKAEELKIVCVCHGMFLSPAEFIKHGGGGDVADPLKHIVVNPSPMFHI